MRRKASGGVGSWATENWPQVGEIPERNKLTALETRPMVDSICTRYGTRRVAGPETVATDEYAGVAPGSLVSRCLLSG